MVAEDGTGKASVVLGDGLGGFSQPTQFVLGSFLADLTVADFNGDGKPDLAIAVSRQDAFPSPQRSAIAVLFGDGSGGFGAGSTISPDANACRARGGDFNRDTP